MTYRLTHEELGDALPDLAGRLTFIAPAKSRVEVTASPYPYPSVAGLPVLGVKIRFLDHPDFRSGHTWMIMLTGVGPTYGMSNSPGLGMRAVLAAWFGATREHRDYRRAKIRLAPIKEELMAAAWAPARVERWVAAGAWDLVDAV